MYDYSVGPNSNGNGISNSTTATTTSSSKKGKLRGLSGMRVKIGRYLGLADDGSCILPWDWEL
jgi:hypothetical protein